MKKIIFLIITFILFTQAGSVAQDYSRIKGSWVGSLDLGGIQLRLVLNISDTTGKLVTLLDSPDQGAKGIPTDSTRFIGSEVVVYATALAAQYSGVLQAGDSLITGKWRQGGGEWDLVMHRHEGAFVLKRPQEPKPPYPYSEEQVTFRNGKAKIDLAGTLSLPNGNGPFPAVVLISGSGPQNRDEELMGHKPFHVIADHLCRKGIAVLRYDDRGTGSSGGNFATATSFDFADDAEAAFQYLALRKEIDKVKIGFAGHSEGGMIAPIIASRNKQTGFIILLAGPGDPGWKILEDQTFLILEKSGETSKVIKDKIKANSNLYDILLSETDSARLYQQLLESITEDVNNSATVKPEERESVINEYKMSFNQLMSPWFRTFLAFDPGEYLSKVKCPVLAINGTNDLQVPYKSNLAAIEKFLKKAENTRYTIKAMDGLNHLFQKSATGLPAEYGKIEETFSVEVLDLMATWIKGL